MAEGQRLQKITRTAKDPIKLRRAIVVLMSAQGRAVGDIVALMRVDEGYVRDVISPEPNHASGTPPGDQALHSPSPARVHQLAAEACT